MSMLVSCLGTSAVRDKTVQLATCVWGCVFWSKLLFLLLRTHSVYTHLQSQKCRVLRRWLVLACQTRCQRGVRSVHARVWHLLFAGPEIMDAEPLEQNNHLCMHTSTLSELLLKPPSPQPRPDRPPRGAGGRHGWSPSRSSVVQTSERQCGGF